MIESYTRHSPSSLNLFAAEPAMFVLEKVLGQRQTVGVPAHRGVAVEEGVAYGLIHPDADLEDCYKEALLKYDMITALSGDDRKSKYRQNVPGMVGMALAELRPYGVPTKVQGYIEWHPHGLQLPIVGYYDFMWEYDGIVVDLKTSERMPSEIKIAHARQVSLYCSDNHEGRLTYCTPKKVQTFRLDETKRHREALFRIAQTVERFLSLSDSPLALADLVVPNLDSFYWGEPVARELAYKIWRI